MHQAQVFKNFGVKITTFDLGELQVFFFHGDPFELWLHSKKKNDGNLFSHLQMAKHPEGCQKICRN